ncbi:MAG: DinB family protein [Alphaproteobacteria bacterium]|nr:MAG: DinB family protein [Alphaproteobacteria bacterium]
MASLDLLVKALDTAHWEMSEAFKGLPDEDTWRRPDPRLLSVGELAAHVAYWESRMYLGEGKIESPLITPAANYYTASVDEPFQLPLGAEQVLQEVQRIHALCKAAFAANPRDSEDPNPNREGATWGFTLEYQAFHVAYHTGQMYSVRHLLGHEPVDN